MTVKTKDLKQNAVIATTPKEVYDAFLDSKKHSTFTGASAVISPKVGGKFSVWDAYATGETLALVPDKKIVQTWRANDWPAGHYSKITLELSFAKGKTTIKFTQTGIPLKNFEEIKQGWIDYYWEPLKEMLESK